MIIIGKFYEKYSDQYISSMKSNYIALCYRRIHLNFLLNFINKTHLKHPRILDLGCGPCFDLKFLASCFKRPDITGVDLAKSFIEHCKYSLPQGNFLNIDILDFLQTTSQTWNIIISNFGVINHFSPIEIRSFFRLVSDKLSNDGILFISFLNKVALNEIIYFLLTLNFNKILRRFHTIHEGFNSEKLKVYFYTISYIRSIAKRFNLEPCGLRGVGWIIPPPYVRINKELIKLLYSIEKQLPLPLFAYLSDLSIIVLKKRGGEHDEKTSTTINCSQSQATKK